MVPDGEALTKAGQSLRLYGAGGVIGDCFY